MMKPYGNEQPVQYAEDKCAKHSRTGYPFTDSADNLLARRTEAAGPQREVPQSAA